MNINIFQSGKSVKEFGALGDGITNDAVAFQKAFDSGLPVISIPFGKYLIGAPLKIGSDTTILAHKRAEIVLGDKVCTKRGEFLLTNQNHDTGDKNISIYGGIWNGNNLQNPKCADLFDSNGYSGALLCFMNVKNLTLSGLTLLDPAAYFTRFCEIDGFLIENISLCAFNIRPNNDGIHLGGFCQNGIVRNITAVTPGTPNDDMIAINADDSLVRVENLDMKCGFIRNIYVDNLYAEKCHSFVRLLSIDSEISNISVNHVRGGFTVMAVNMDAARYCRTPLVDPSSARYVEGVGSIENVTINDMQVYCTSAGENTSYLRLESNMSNFKLTGFKRLWELEAKPSGSTMFLQNVRASKLRFAGLCDLQTESLAKTCKDLSVSQYVTDTEEENYCAEIKTTVGDKVILPNGGFDRLVIYGRDE